MLSSDDDYEFESLESLRMDLEELKARGNQMRLEHRRELQSLRSEFEPLLDTLHATHEHQADSPMYHQVMEPKRSSSSLQAEEKKDEGGFEEISQEEADDEEEPQFAPFVRKIQSQLCGALHQQEVNQRQIKFAQRSNKRLIVFLSTEIEAQKAISKKREEDFEVEYKETESANQIMMDMLEKDALDQEEIITSMRLQLGMDPTPNSQRKNFRQRHRRRMQRLSGGLRNLGRRVRATPRNIRDSKVWKDLVTAATEEEQGVENELLDASERRRGIMQRLRRSSRTVNEESESSSSSSLPQENNNNNRRIRNRFHSSKVEKLSLDDIENEGRLGIVGRIRRSRQMRRESTESQQQYLENRKSVDSFEEVESLNDTKQQQQLRPLQGVRRRASNLRRGLFQRQNSGKSLDSMGSTQPPTPPTNEKALFPMDDASFDQEVFALSI